MHGQKYKGELLVRRGWVEVLPVSVESNRQWMRAMCCGKHVSIYNIQWTFKWQWRRKEQLNQKDPTVRTIDESSALMADYRMIARIKSATNSRCRF